MASRLTKERRAEIKQKIAAAMFESDARRHRGDAKRVIMREFGISEVNYYALAKEVRREGPGTDLQPDVEAVQEIAAAHLGARPTAQDLLHAGGQQYIDVLPRWHAMWADTMLLRNHAVDAEGRLLDPDLLQRSVQRRQQLLESIPG